MLHTPYASYHWRECTKNMCGRYISTHVNLKISSFKIEMIIKINTFVLAEVLWQMQDWKKYKTIINK